jgi:hypothetical protein
MIYLISLKKITKNTDENIEKYLNSSTELSQLGFNTGWQESLSFI